MEYKRLGRTGLKVSELCMGCMTFGKETDEKTAIEMVSICLDAGVNFFDTANVYNEGRSEEILGKALKTKRDRAVVATKVYGTVRKQDPNGRGLSRNHIFGEVETSLRRLGTDTIDLYQVHHWDAETPIEETIRALDDLVHQGKVRYLGASNFTGWQLAKALWTSDRHNLHRFECLQPRYSLMHREAEFEFLPLCRAEQIGVIPWSPLASGILSGKYADMQKPAAGTRFADNEWLRSRYAKLGDVSGLMSVIEKLAKAREKTFSQVALNWVACREAITAPIIGARTMVQLKENLSSVGWHLSSEELDALDKASLRPIPPAEYMPW